MKVESQPSLLLFSSTGRLLLELGGIALLVVGVVLTFPGPGDRGSFEAWATPVLLFIVGVIWIALMWSLARAAGAQPWLFREEVDPDAADLPKSLRDRIARVRTQAVTFEGRSWRTGPAISELAAEGDLPLDLRWPVWLGNGHGLLVALGLAGTFFGLTMGLLRTDLTGAQDAPTALAPLLNGAKLAFSKSLAGIVLATLWSLRLRHAENLRAQYLDGLAEVLDAERPFLTLTQMQASLAHAQMNAAQRQIAVLEALNTRATVQHAAAMARWSELHEAALAQADEHHDESKVVWNDLAAQLANGFEQNGATFRAAIAEMVLQVRSALEKVPSGVTEDLGPKLDAIAGALATISKRAGKDLDDVFKKGLDESVSQMAAALQAVVTELQRLPPKLTEATTSLEQAHKDIQTTLPAVADAAGKLKEAGEATGNALRGAADPMRNAVGAMQGAADAVDRAASAMGSTAPNIDRARENFASVANSSGELATHLATLAQQTQSLRDAVVTTMKLLETTNTEQRSVSADTAQRMREAVESFTAALAKIEEVLKNGTTEGAKEAARIAAEAAQKVAEAMSSLGEHAKTVMDGMKSAEQSGAALREHTAALASSMERVAAPLLPVADALNNVPEELNRAADLLGKEREAIAGVAGHAEAAARDVRTQAEALGTNIAAFERVNAALTNHFSAQRQDLQQINAAVSETWRAQKQGLVDANAHVVSAWQHAAQRTFMGADQLQAQLIARAAAVEQSLRLPHDLKSLDVAITDLTDTLADLNVTLKLVRPDGDGA